MTVSDCFAALAKKSTAANNRIIWNIRVPRVLAAIIAGAGLSVSGLVMQTNLNNPMASPSTLGVSNAAVFGANFSIIAFAGGFLSTGSNVANTLVTFTRSTVALENGAPTLKTETICSQFKGKLDKEQTQEKLNKANPNTVIIVTETSYIEEVRGMKIEDFLKYSVPVQRPASQRSEG